MISMIRRIRINTIFHYTPESHAANTHLIFGNFVIVSAPFCLVLQLAFFSLSLFI